MIYKYALVLHDNYRCIKWQNIFLFVARQVRWYLLEITNKQHPNQLMDSQYQMSNFNLS